MKKTGYRIQQFPRQRAVVIDSGYLGARRHISYALIEIDVTHPRRVMDAWEAARGEKLSFTAYLLACLSSALQAFPEVQAYRDWRGRLVLFDDVDIVTLIEPQAGKVAIPHIMRAVNNRTVDDLTAEIRQVQAQPASSAQSHGLARLGVYAPRPARMLSYWALRKNPLRMKELAGTAVLTSVGMFGQGGGWGVSFLPMHTFGMLVGGITERLALDNDKLVRHEMLCVTLSFDHDIVDGAPAARFTNFLRQQIENSEHLDKINANLETLRQSGH